MIGIAIRARYVLSVDEWQFNLYFINSIFIRV